MKIGVSAFAWTTRVTTSHLALLPKLREQGLDAFEIPMFDPDSLPAREIRRAFEASQLDCTVCAILPPHINPISPDSKVRNDSITHLLRCIEVSAEIGAKLIAGPLCAPIGYLPPRRRSADEWTWAVEAFQSVGEVLDAHQMTLSLEPVNRSETFFLRTALEAKALCQEINHRRVGVTLDTFHANIEEKNIPETVRQLGHQLRHVHASENDRSILGSGHVNFPAMIAALREIGYRGILMIEGFGYCSTERESLGVLWGDPAVTPEDIAFRGAAYLRALWDKVDLGPN